MCLDLSNMYICGCVLCRSALIKSEGSIHSNMVGICRSECWLYVGGIPSCFCAASCDPATEPLVLFFFVGATLLLASALFVCVLFHPDYAGFFSVEMTINRIMMEIWGTVASKRGRGRWYTPHMAAASRAITERIPLLDFVLEVRDARIPLSSEYQLLRNCPPSFRQIVVLNKADLATPSKLKEWINHFEQQNCISYGVNSHNKDNVKQLLNFLQGQVREFKKIDHHGSTITMMIVGIPNVGKSALANSLHQIGRISAAEKGKLKNAAVSPLPGETKDITSLKIASHPNIYVLDTPGILPPQILDLDVYSKLALTGAITDCYVGEKVLAEYFLAILNLSDQYKKWRKLSTIENDKSSMNQKIECSTGSDLDMKEKTRYSTDHTQDVTVHSVRQSLFNAISSFDGNVQNEKDLEKLIEVELKALQEVFLVSSESGDGGLAKTAAKLLNLYRTGRLGRYTLDHITWQSKLS